MSSGLFRCKRDDGHVQAAADHLGNLSGGYALFGDRVIPGARIRFLQREPVQVGSIKAMSGRPAVEPIADVSHDSLLAGDLDLIRN
jgi:hypothetical protein